MDSRPHSNRCPRYEGGVRSTAWISGGPLDAAVVAAGGVAPSKQSGQAMYFGLMHARLAVIPRFDLRMRTLNATGQYRVMLSPR